MSQRNCVNLIHSWNSEDADPDCQDKLERLNFSEEEELVFPLDTSIYDSFVKRNPLARNGQSAIYAIAAKARTPTKIGVSSDLSTLLASIQRGNWLDLYCYYALWFPGPELAECVNTWVHLQLENIHITNKWFRTNPTEAKKIIVGTASRTFPNVTVADHGAIIEALKRGRK
jgi:hypothetical protein